MAQETSIWILQIDFSKTFSFTESLTSYMLGKYICQVIGMKEGIN